MSTLLIDVDGTLIDSYPGIRAAFEASMEAVGHPLPDEEFLRRVSGPPIEESFAALGFTAEQITAASKAFRASYDSTGWRDCALFPGWEETLEQWKREGKTLCTATSKGEVIARRMLEHLGVAHLFDVIGGADRSVGREAKSDVIAHVLRQLKQLNPPSSPTGSVLMIGDRHHDVVGAAAHGIRTVLVRWGHGYPQEWEQAYALAQSMDELKGIVRDQLG
ncbi:HAD hydrolase-like protein [Corynebacterium kozikiae]|uniref:HAD hydrolase-like protein n=1 Tax=Corynebacterium kozikiae TaxID=2968469 RepID=UPI00211C574A|nr:HAD hydrolase-like protein [Corynebacterium sp. 76QC2CO]MCQ9342210.1 HAD hydrolase-like protein [Corynebacterium sp. 76QC2CO]